MPLLSISFISTFLTLISAALFPADRCKFFAEYFIFLAVKDKSKPENHIQHEIKCHPDIVQRILVENVEVEGKYLYILKS